MFNFPTILIKYFYKDKSFEQFITVFYYVQYILLINDLLHLHQTFNTIINSIVLQILIDFLENVFIDCTFTHYKP